jgi:hypothetical protein
MKIIKQMPTLLTRSVEFIGNSIYLAMDKQCYYDGKKGPRHTTLPVTEPKPTQHSGLEPMERMVITPDYCTPPTRQP